MAAPTKIPSSNNQSIRYVSGIEENFIILNKGKTGVDLQYHEQDEYFILTTAQKDELCEWRNQKKKKVKGNGNSRNGGKKQGSGSHTTENNNKKKKANIAAQKTYIRSLKELLTHKSKTMATLKTHIYIPNRKVKGVDNTVSFTNNTNSDLHRPNQRQN